MQDARRATWKNGLENGGMGLNLVKKTCSPVFCDCHVEASDALPHTVDGGIHVESHLLCSDSLSHKLQDNKGVELLAKTIEHMLRECDDDGFDKK